MIKATEVRGFQDILELPKVSIVGTRKPSAWGIEYATRFAKYFAKKQIPVVSGLALGIDTVAHRTCLDIPDTTKGEIARCIAVLGTPLDKIYPAENKGLADEILKMSGVLVSTYKPGEKMGKHLFPRRNKLMARISNATIVIEAGVKSGTIHQCRETIKSKGQLFFTKPQIEHEWVKEFIEQGAHVVEHPEEVNKILHDLEI